MDILSIENIAFTLLGYDLSWIELIGTLAGLLCVYLASRNNILNWPLGLLNVSLFFYLFYQIHMYADMGLQIYFFITGIIGWVYWSKQKGNLKKISTLSHKSRVLMLLILAVGTLVIYYITSNLHIWYPVTFSEPSSYPFWDSVTTTLSVAGNLMLAFRILENWILWIIVNIISAILYYFKGVLFVSIEFVIFLAIAISGLTVWWREYRSYSYQ